MIWPELEDPLYMNDKVSDISASLHRHATKRYGKRSMHLVTQIICHSSGTLNGSPESFARYHVNKLGWPGIGYHVVFNLDHIWITQPLDTVSFHCSGQNTRSIGICYIGDFDRQVCTPEIYQRYAEVIHLINAMTKRHYTVNMHRKFTNRKSCPGRHFHLKNLTKYL